MRRAPARWVLGLLGLLAAGPAAGQVISFNRTAGQVEVGTCEGLKKHVELGVDVSVVVTANLRCTQAISVPTGVEVWVGSAAGENYLVAVAEDFAVTDPTSATLLVNPAGSRLTLDELTFANEAGTTGSPGAARAVWNEGTLDVNGCYFLGLNYASVQDGGAIYSTGSSAAGSAYVNVRNSTFVGNIAENYGGAISSWGLGEVEVSNCSFVGNEAVGFGDDRRAGSGGGIFASPGVFVTVLNSSFEDCLGRYGGGALFACGADIFESTFAGNEATGLFGAVVNGDLSDEDRAAATVALGGGVGGGGGQGQNYTCPPLYVSGTIFDANLAVTGYGGAIASVESSLYVSNSSLLDTLGGAIYFGTSDTNGRDQLELDKISFENNDGSATSPNFFGAALLLERTGSPVSNTTGDFERVEPSTSSSSSGGSVGVAAVQQSVVYPGFVGEARDIYCFQNNPYDCEAYFGGDNSDGGGGDIAVRLTGTIRCNACKGSAFTGIGSPAGAPITAPADVDDDDGLSKMGQERAQGGTPAPAAPDLGTDRGTGDVVAEEGEPELLGATGGMRWVVVGLIAGIGGALLVCMCMLTVCRIRERKSRGARASERLEEDNDLSGAAIVGPRGTSSATGATVETGLGRSTSSSKRSKGGRGAGGGGGSAAAAAAMREDVRLAASPGTSAIGLVDGNPSRPSSRRPSGTSGVPPPGGTTSSRRPSRNDSSRSSSRRPSVLDRDPRRDTSDSAVAVVNVPTPVSSELRARELARQRSAELAAAVHADGWASPPLVSAWGDDVPVGGAGAVCVSARSTPTKQGFVPLTDNHHTAENPDSSGGHARGDRSGERRGPSVRPAVVLGSAEAAAEAAAQVFAVPRGRQEERGRGSGIAGRRGSGSAGRRGSGSAGRRGSGSADRRGSGSTSRRSSGRDMGSGATAAAGGGSSKNGDWTEAQHQYPSRSRSRERTTNLPPFHAPAPMAVVSSRRAGGGSGGVGTKKIKPPSGGGGGIGMYSSPYGSPSRERTRAVKTPAGGARLSISAATSPVESSSGRRRGRGRDVSASGRSSNAAAAAAVAGVATELEAAGETTRPDSMTIISSEENPVFQARGGTRGGRSRFLSRSPARSRSRSKSRRGDSAERTASGGGGWAAELYRMSPTPRKDRSAKVYSGKFDSSRSDWSADGNVEWNRFSPTGKDGGREKRF